MITIKWKKNTGLIIIRDGEKKYPKGNACYCQYGIVAGLAALVAAVVFRFYSPKIISFIIS